MTFPKMELGYHYQEFIGQKFNGLHTGISIPLWQNKNTVKQKKAQFLFADLDNFTLLSLLPPPTPPPSPTFTYFQQQQQHVGVWDFMFNS